MSAQDQEPEDIQKRLAEDVPKFVNDNLDTWIAETILRQAQMYARAANMPRKFIDNIRVESGPGGFDLVNEWKGKKGEPLAEWFEFGTERHWVEPKDKDGVLAWPAVAHGKQRNAPAIYFKRGTKKGTMLFSKGHYVSGLPAIEPMTRGVEQGIHKLKRRIRREVKNKFAYEDNDYKVVLRA